MTTSNAGNAGTLARQNNNWPSPLDEFFGSNFWPFWMGDHPGGSVVSAQKGSDWNTRIPRVDVSETDKEVTVTADMPGLSKESVNVEVDERERILKISGKTDETRETKQDDTKYHVKERVVGQFSRQIRLADRWDPTQVTAVFNNGVLTVKMPVTVKPENARAIPIQ
jgi:HSP20 family molecular chaperone IbpA